MAVEVVACSGAAVAMAVAMAVALVAALVARKSTSTVRFYQGKTRFHFLQPETMKRTGERIWQEFWNTSCYGVCNSTKVALSNNDTADTIV